MKGRIAAIVVTAMLVACGKDKAADVPVQQQAADTTPLTKAAPAPATKTAPPPAPRPAPPSPEALAAAELASATLVRTVQVGAFPSATAATWWASELQKQGIPAYTTTARVDSAEVTRLRIGAALTAAEARAIADKIHERYKWPVWITMVDDKSVLPANALFASRTYAGAGARP
jgi:cell division septation protein DedD